MGINRLISIAIDLFYFIQRLDFYKCPLRLDFLQPRKELITTLFPDLVENLNFLSAKGLVVTLRYPHLHGHRRLRMWHARALPQSVP